MQGRGGARTRVASLLWLAMAAALLAGGGPAGSATARLPDLGMAQLSDLRIDKLTTGQRVLRYSTTIVNTGTGPFELHGSRASTSDATMAITQRVYNDDGTYSESPVSGTYMYYAGDGHNHWHVRDLESTDLIRLDNGSKVGTSGKHGFCFWDNVAFRLTLPGAPQSGVYTGCGTQTSLAVTVGLSVGWGDLYSANLPDQYIDITNLSPGRYRLVSTADAQHWFTESNTTNNSTWVDIQLKNGNALRILGYGPSA